MGQVVWSSLNLISSFCTPSSSDEKKGTGTKSTSGSDTNGNKSGCTFIFYLGGCCGREKKFDMRRQTSQQNSFEEVPHFKRAVWSSLYLHLFTHHQHLQVVQSYFHQPCHCLFHHLYRSTHHVGCILLFFLSFLFSIIKGPNWIWFGWKTGKKKTQINLKVNFRIGFRWEKLIR